MSHEEVTIENETPSTILDESFTETTTIWVNEDIMTTSTSLETTAENVNNISIGDADNHQLTSESQELFEAFIIIEIVMTAFELILSILAASKVARWRRNFRNQLLMQFSLVRFLKRVYTLIYFLVRNSDKTILAYGLPSYLSGVQFYLDFVTVILVCFFIKHMYDSLIVVVCKINRNELVKVIMCSWLLPIPFSATGAGLVSADILTYRTVFIFICAAFKWPLMIIGTLVYLVILYRVTFDKIRQFARSLTTITFLLCLVINLHLFCKDVIWMWCIESFTTNLVSYLTGFLMNVLVLCLYIMLITLHLKCKKSKSNGDYSEYVTKC